MTFLELSLENVGAFRGRHTLNLVPVEGRSLILIGALNGSGKTTLLNAFQLALYGKESHGIRGVQTYQKHLRQLINSGAASTDGASLELTLDLHQETGRGPITVQRRWWRSDRNDVREQLTVFIDGRRDEELTEGWDTFIAGVLPPRLADLFFFDGEKIEALTESDRAADIIRKGLYVLLGLDQIEELRRNLRTVRRRRASTIEDAPAERSFVVIEERIAALQAEKEILLQKRAATQNAFDSSRRVLGVAEAAFREGGGEVFALRQEWHKRHAQVSTEIESLNEQLKQGAAKEMPLLLVPHLLDEAYQLTKKSEESATTLIISKAIQARDKEYLRILRELGLPKTMAKSISVELEQLLPKIPAGTPTTTLGLRSERLNRYMHGQRNELKKQALSLLALLAERKAQLTEVRLAQESVPSETQIADLSAALQKAQSEHTRLESTLAALDGELARVGTQMLTAQANLDAEIQEAATRDSANADARRVIRHIGLADETLANYLKVVVQQRSKEVADQILESFRSIARKGDLISTLSVNSESFELSLFGANGNAIDPQELSAGERQILAFATLNGLAKAAGKRIPTLIDSPLGRLDGVHRERIARHYFPSASHQTIIFSTDKEVDHEMWLSLEPSLAHSYLLNFNEVSNATAIASGYFEAR